MLRLILGRLMGGVVVVLAVATFSFFMLRAAPGGPFDEERQLPAEIKRNIEKRYKLDQPVWSQYASYMSGLIPFVGGKGLAIDLGHSMKRTQSVWGIIGAAFPYSVRLGLSALAFAIVLGVALGVLAAARQNSALDHGAMGFALLGISVPSLVLGPLLIMIFSIQLMWLPPARASGWASMILPAATLGLIYIGIIARLARSGMLETLRQDYVRTARAKGLAERTVVWKHAVRLGLMPVVTYLGPATAGLITGSFVVEQIFQIPGLGFYTVNSVVDRDYPLLSGVLVFYSVFLVLLNLAVDIAYCLLDPRIRSAR
jgi:ABC-type dipeptide/oligopeptide/nickel transport system permease component